MKTKYIALNLILFSVLYFAVSFNKEFIRPLVGDNHLVGILTGSFPNFMAAYIISLFPIAAILARNLNLKKSRLIIYMVAFIVFLILTAEEFQPFFGASTVYDIYDIIANGLGAILSILTFELLLQKTKLFKMDE